MAILKCKMCGGDLNITADETVVECEYCGSKQTVPTADNEKKMNLFARANRLLRNCEFDKAAGIYESIVAEFPEEAEAYWGLVLCKYGIEYVDDPATGNKVPTCHRSSFDSVMDDKDFELVMEYADGIARRVYREQAKQMEELRKAIIEVSGKEEPYDIFISYKETDDSGDRTLDSVIAQDIYTELTGKGYRVFFSRISLEDKLGTEYEPYIFAALNSAKVMLVVGTDYDYFNAVWVKNEWSRFLALIAKGEKKTLIPVFKNIDAYDMPKEFAKLSAQDMGKVGAMQDLLRGVDKILGKTAQPAAAPAQPQTVIQQVVGGNNFDALIQRGYMSLEDAIFGEAQGFFNDALNIDAKSAEAYLGLFMAQITANNKYRAEKVFVAGDYTQNRYYQRAKQFAEGTLKAELEDWEKKRSDRLAKEAEEARKAEETERKQREDKKKELSDYREKIKPFQSLISRVIYGLKSNGTVVSACHFGEELKSWNNIIDIIGYPDFICGLKTNGSVIAIQESSSDYNFESWNDIVELSEGVTHIVGLKRDGNVVATGDNDDGQCNLENWSSIVKVICGNHFTAGLKDNGTVVVTEGNDDVQFNVDDWKDIIDIDTNGFNIIGLKKNGTVVAVGDNIYEECSVENWRDIIKIECFATVTVGVKNDGTVVVAGDNKYGQRNIEDWRDVVNFYYAGCGYNEDHMIGLKNDGTVVAAGANNHGQCDVGKWTNVVEVYCDDDYTLGLKSDGTVVAAGNNKYGQLNVKNWQDIVAINSYGRFILGLKKDGTVVAAGDRSFLDGYFNFKGWKLFDDFEHFEEECQKYRAAALKRDEEERIQEIKKAEEERIREEKIRQEKIVALETEKAKLETELPTIKGLFSGGQRKKVEARIAEIEKELKQLQN